MDDPLNNLSVQAEFLPAQIAEALLEAMRRLEPYLLRKAGGQKPSEEDWSQLRSQGREVARSLNLLGRLADEALRACPFGITGEELRMLSPLLKAYGESFSLVALAESWEELLDMPIISQETTQQMMGEELQEFLREHLVAAMASEFELGIGGPPIEMAELVIPITELGDNV